MDELTKHAGGRPSIYNPQVLKDTQFYLHYYSDLGDVVPSIEGLARYLKIGLSTIKRWASDEGKEEFRATLEDIKTEQAHVLINKGLTSEINATIGKLMLHNHGYHEKAEIANYDMGGNAPDKEWAVSYPSHADVSMERVEEAQAKLDKDKEEFNRLRLSFNESNDKDKGEQDNDIEKLEE